MAKLYESVQEFLEAFRTKSSVFGIIFTSREKNTQTLLDLELTVEQLKGKLLELTVQDYSQGPTEDQQFNGASLWVFGKQIKGKEIYIKITLGHFGDCTVCISFHEAEFPMRYPLRN